MTPLLSVPLALALTTLLGLTLLAVAVATVLLLLLALLALDVLLERNGVDRRAGVLRFWRRLRTPPPARPDAATRKESGAAAPGTAGAGTSEPSAAPRVPFSARRPARPRESAPVAEAEPRPATDADADADADTTVIEAEDPAAIAVAESPTPASDAVTEVLAVPQVPSPRARSPRAARAPRPTPRRTPTPDPGPSPEPADRDSAMDRLFAPLLESDRTEPLSRAARPPRRPRDDG